MALMRRIRRSRTTIFPSRTVRSVIDRPVRAIVDHVFSAIDAFVGAAPQFDDIPLLVVRRTVLTNGSQNSKVRLTSPLLHLNFSVLTSKF